MSDDVLPEIERLHGLGRSTREIGIAVGLETQVVQRIMLVNGLRHTRNYQALSPTEIESLQSMASQGMTTAEIGKALRVSPKSVMRNLRELGLWTHPDEIKYMSEELGMTNEEIAENLGVPWQRVSASLCEKRRTKKKK